jgi:hypothetical protein
MVLADLNDTLSDTVKHLLAGVSDLLGDVQDEVMRNLEVLSTNKLLNHTGHVLKPIAGETWSHPRTPSASQHLPPYRPTLRGRWT